MCECLCPTYQSTPWDFLSHQPGSRWKKVKHQSLLPTKNKKMSLQPTFARAVTFLTGELDRDGAWANGCSPFLLQTLLYRASASATPHTPCARHQSCAMWLFGPVHPGIGKRTARTGDGAVKGGRDNPESQDRGVAKNLKATANT